MTDDLLARLRVFHEYDADKSSLICEAADRNEQLEAALQKIVALPLWEEFAAIQIARAAQEGEDE